MVLKRMLLKPIGDLSLKEIFVCLFLLLIIFNIIIYFTSFKGSQLTSGLIRQRQEQSTDTIDPRVIDHIDDDRVALINNKHNRYNQSINNNANDAVNLPTTTRPTDLPNNNPPSTHNPGNNNPTTTPYFQSTAFKPEKKRSWPIPPGAACKRPKRGRPKDDGRWFDFGANGMFLYAYTAIVDDREAIGSDPVVRVIGLANIIENMAHPPSMTCRFYYPLDKNGDLLGNDDEEENESNSGKSRLKYRDLFVDVQVEKHPIRKIGMGWQLNYKLVREYIFTCPLPTANQLKSNLKVGNSNVTANRTSNVPHPRWLTLLVGEGQSDGVTSCMPIEVPEKPNVKKDFALCVQVGYGSIDPVQLVEWMELQKMLGVDVIGFYDMEIHEPAMRVLRYYAEQGLVDLRRSDYIPNGPTQFLLHGSPVINDCMYRRIHSHRYLLVYDIDEVILPLKNSSGSKTLNNFKSLMKVIKENYGDSPNLYLFRNHYFFFDLSHDESEPSEFRLLKYRKSAPISSFGYSTKSITDMQTCIQMHNHYCWGYTSKYQSMTLVDVHRNLAVNQHYKKCHLSPQECAQLLKNSHRNNAIAPYREELIENVHRAVKDMRRTFVKLNVKDPFHGYFKEIIS